MKARLYDWEATEVLGRTDQDLTWWREAVRDRDPVLELACGTGRLTIPLHQTGVEVVGLDIDPDMLAVLVGRPSRAGTRPVAPFSNGGSPPVIAGDMRAFALHRAFGAVIIPYNSLQLLSGDGEAEQCLACAAAHLRREGVVAVEVTDFQRGAVSTTVVPELLHRGRFEGATATLWGGLDHDLDARRSRYHRRIELSPGGIVVDETITLRCFDRAELAMALAAAGLEPISWWWPAGPGGATLRVVAASTGRTVPS